MRRAVHAVAASVLLLGPTAVAFFSGGYFGEPRLVAAITAWVLVLALAVAGPVPLPRRRAAIVALAGLVAMAAWTALSVGWAPLGGPAIAAVQRLVLYTGALLVAIGALRSERALRCVEPALASGATVVIGYGLAGRLLPGIVHLSASRAAGGRLEQPITYWNGEGALAAVGFLLCARMAGDRTRPAWLRAAAAAMTVPLAAGVYLSYSRGAIAVAVLGLVVLVALAPSTAQLRAAGLALGAGILAAIASALFPGVAALEGGERTRDGAVALILLLVLAGAAGALAARDARRPDAPLRRVRRLGPATAVVVALVTAGLVIGALGERASQEDLARGAGAARLTTVNSNRYEYWRVALIGFKREPLRGLGAGGFRVLWLQERTVDEAVRDTHSLEFEMATELGLVGLLALAALIGGTAAAARDALRRDRVAAAGPSAAVLAWVLHASIDWDWQLPAVTLPAIVLASALIAIAERGADPAGAGPRAPGAPSRDRRAP